MNQRINDTEDVAPLNTYCRQALKLSEIVFLGQDEGYAARIPGFRGLIATGSTKKEALAELETALVDWINLALNRGLGLPPLRPSKQALVTGR
jgi:predicted RNase H-like HicB family nuclease